MKPPSGTMVYWRHKSWASFRFGYVSYTGDYNLVRMGPWNGNTTDGPVVDINEIEWRPYR